MKNSRRDFIKKSAMTGAATYLGTLGLSAQHYRNIIGSNDRVRVGVVGFSDRHKDAHIPSFLKAYKELNFDIIAVSDIWKKRREDGSAYLKQKFNHDITACKNNDELYNMKEVDAVMISTADFQHALHTVEAVKAAGDTYTENRWPKRDGRQPRGFKSGKRIREDRADWLATQERRQLPCGQ